MLLFSYLNNGMAFDFLLWKMKAIWKYHQANGTIGPTTGKV